MNDGEFKILIVDDEPNIRSGLCKGLQGLADRVDVAAHGEDGLEKFAQTAYDLVITDLRLPGSVDGLGLLSLIHDQAPDTVVIVITAFGSVETAVEAMRRGAFDFVTKPVDLNMIRQQVRKASEHCRLKKENRLLRERLEGEGEIPEMVSNCAATRDMLRQIRQVAPTDATVLLSGESGTGKELAARAIHQLSPRKEQPFVAVHLGVLPDTLLESELFGHEKGAFTGAQGRKTGRFEAANGGTIFLDEITEMSAKSQVDLLRVLEQREIRRLGGEDVVPLDVRVISATNKDLDRLVADGAFREDIYYRLNVVPIRIPPLRRRARIFPCWSTSSDSILPTTRSPAKTARPRRHGDPAGVLLAREHPSAAQFPRTDGDHHRHGRDSSGSIAGRNGAHCLSVRPGPSLNPWSKRKSRRSASLWKRANTTANGPPRYSISACGRSITR